MIACMKYWIAECSIDGFRCDMAHLVPLDFWVEARDQCDAVKPLFWLAECEVPEYHKVFYVTYAWKWMHIIEKLVKGFASLQHVKEVLKSYNDYPPGALKLFFTSNHDENSWNGTEYEKYGDACKAFAVFTQTMYQSVPLIYSGQEIPNKKRLKFFVKDTLALNDKFEMAPFYKTLLKLRKSTPALAADASYKKLVTANDVAIFAYTREKHGHKIAVVLNLSNQPQSFTIKEKIIYDEPMNVFMGVKEKVNSTHVFTIEPWGYVVYNFDK